MKDQRKTEIKVGITVVVGILIFIWILGWAKNFQLASSEIELKILFSNVSGLQIGNDVTVNGIKKGFVKDYYIEQNNVIVIVSLYNTVDLRTDAVFKIEMTDLMGSKKIEIYPGQSTEALDITATQTGVFQSDLTGLMTSLGSMESDFKIIIEDIKKSLSSVNTYLLDDKIKADLKSTLSNMNEVSEKLNTMITQNQNDFREIVTNTKDITSETKEFLRTNSDNLNGSIMQLNSLLKKSDSLFTKMNYLADETISGNNNLGKILYNDSLMVNLSQTMQQVNELTKIILYQLQNDGFKVDADIF
ncbi:MAG TPA: MlaD family protein [Ignavibacteriaceae bacterium]|nr:MlaD family protein [Ignavibacteriaceae bacterium]